MDKNLLSEESTSSEKKLLGTKRNSSGLSENFIFRKALTNNISGNYEKISSIYRNIFSFDWEDEKISKLKSSPLAYMSAPAFWYYISSQYFPFISNEFFNNSEELKNMFNILLEKFSVNKLLKKNKHLFNKKSFLYDIISMISPEAIIEENKNNDKKINQTDNFEKPQTYRIDHLNTKKSLPVNNIINEIESILRLIQLKNEGNFSDICDKISNNKEFICIDSPEKELIIDYEDILTDMQYCSNIVQNYHDYLVEKHNQNIKIKENCEILTKFEDEQNKTVPDDVVCAVCNSGDYEDNDLIVFCSTCNIAVHQNCYGILKIPKDDWICDSCLCFGLEGSKKLDCILCPVKGGALKISNLRKRSNFVKNILSLSKKNKSVLFEISSNNNTIYSSSCYNNKTLLYNESQVNDDNPLSTLNNENECIKTLKEENESNSNLSPEKKFDIEMKETESKLPCNGDSSIKKKNRKKIKKGDNNNEEDDESKQKLLKISQENVWVHLSCALWIAEVKIQKYEIKSDISDIENIDKKRFQDMCSICKNNNCGVTENCFKENCSSKFHIECARINKYHLEIITFKNENKYVIYCEFHRPQKLMKNLEMRRQRTIEDIVSYSKVLEKCYEQVNSLKKGESIKSSNNIKKNIHRLSLKSKYKKKDKDKIIRQVKYHAKDISRFFIVLKNKRAKVPLNKKETTDCLVETDTNISNYEIVKKPGIKINYQDTLNPAIFPWNKIFIEGLTTKDIFSLYKRLVPNEYIFSKIILNKSFKKNHEIIINIINNKDKTQCIERYKPDPNLYCYCKKQYSDEFMIGCSSEDNCPVGGWIHKDCDEILKGLPMSQIQETDFTCKECSKIKENSSLIENIQINLNKSFCKDIKKDNICSDMNNQLNYQIEREEPNALIFKMISNDSTPNLKLQNSNCKTDIIINTNEEFTILKQDSSC